MKGPEQFGRDIETTEADGHIYDVRKLESYAEQLPITAMPIEELKELVGAGREYWLDSEGNRLGPADLLSDWEKAKKNPAWESHVRTVENENLEEPIWIYKGEVINGMHRLTGAILRGVKEISVRVFESLPNEAIVEKHAHEQ